MLFIILLLFCPLEYLFEAFHFHRKLNITFLISLLTLWVEKTGGEERFFLDKDALWTTFTRLVYFFDSTIVHRSTHTLAQTFRLQNAVMNEMLLLSLKLFFLMVGKILKVTHIDQQCAHQILKLHNFIP